MAMMKKRLINNLKYFSGLTRKWIISEELITLKEAQLT
jgi:hypothetical protein